MPFPLLFLYQWFPATSIHIYIYVYIIFCYIVISIYYLHILEKNTPPPPELYLSLNGFKHNEMFNLSLLSKNKNLLLLFSRNRKCIYLKIYVYIKFLSMNAYISVFVICIFISFLYVFLFLDADVSMPTFNESIVFAVTKSRQSNNIIAFPFRDPSSLNVDFYYNFVNLKSSDLSSQMCIEKEMNPVCDLKQELYFIQSSYLNKIIPKLLHMKMDLYKKGKYLLYSFYI